MSDIRNYRFSYLSAIAIAIGSILGFMLFGTCMAVIAIYAGALAMEANYRIEHETPPIAESEEMYIEAESEQFGEWIKYVEIQKSDSDDKPTDNT